MGQGVHTVALQVAAQELGIDPDRIDVIVDTTRQLGFGQTTGSRGTLMAAGAVQQACAAALADGCRPDVDYHAEHVVDWTAKLGDPDHPNPTIHAAFGYAAQLAIVDRESGKVERVVAVHDVGKAVNPVLCEGQIEGSVHMGLGYALTEDFPTDPETGFPTFSTLRQLGILRAKDVPAIEVAAGRGAAAAVAVRDQGRRRDRPRADRPGRRRRPPRPRRRVAQLTPDARRLTSRRARRWSRMRAPGRTRQLVAGVVERADRERQAAAADAAVEVVAQPLQRGDLVVERGPASCAESWAQSLRFGVRPSGSDARASTDLGEREPDPLGGLDEGHPAQHVGVVLAVAGGRRSDVISPCVLVEPQRRRRDAGAGGDRADRKRLTSTMVEVLPSTDHEHNRRPGHPLGREARRPRRRLDEMVRVGGRRLCLVRTGDGVFALDHACPHEGYGLTQGTLDGDLLTCAWHNWKFRVDDGACVLGEEDVRTHAVTVAADGALAVTIDEPDPAELRPRLLASLRRGIENDYVGQVVARRRPAAARRRQPGRADLGGRRLRRAAGRLRLGPLRSPRPPTAWRWSTCTTATSGPCRSCRASPASPRPSATGR